jgi:hypothetical protein
MGWEKQLARAEAERGNDDGRHRRNRLAWSVSSWAALHQESIPSGLRYGARSSRGPMLVIALFLSVFTSVMAVREDHASVVLIFLVLWAAGIAFHRWTAAQVQRALGDERDWQAAQPFAIEGYEDCLADHPRENRSHIALALAFAGQPPPVEWLLQLLSSDGADWTWDARAELARRAVGIDAAPDVRDEHNRALRDWFHALVDNQLAVLHARHPLARVHLLNSRAHG